MDFFEFLVKNWSQIVVLIAALGYLLKVILDFNIKKNEIKFEYLYKEKATAFKEYLLSFQNFKALLTQQSFEFIYNNISFQEFESKMKIARDELQANLNIIYMYCTEKEKESLYSILNSSTAIIYKVKNSNDQSLSDILEDYNSQNSQVIKKFIKKFHI